jgi:hypothetical protein
LCPERVTHRYQQLIINSVGAWYDGVGTLRGTDAKGWDAVPVIKTAKTAAGWTVDLAISWKEIGHAPPKSGEVWSMDVRRWRYAGGKDEQWSWAFNGRPPGGATHHAEAFGFVRFE